MRREVARACAYGARTAGDIARYLGKERGSVTSTVRGLVSEGVLRTTTVAHSPGEAYVLVPRWRRRLEKAIGSADPRGLLQPGLRVLIVGGRDAGALADVMADVAALPALVWCARVDGAARLLIATRGETVEERGQVDRLEAALGRAGLDCVQLRVDRVLELADVDRYARTLAVRPPQPSLRTGSGSS
jgi:hypothetical protein